MSITTATNSTNDNQEADENWIVSIQILILEYVGYNIETYIGRWSRICRASYHFIKENINRMSLKSFSQNIQLI